MIRKIKLNKPNIINLLFLIGILFIGSDKISFNIAGFNFKLVQFLFLFISLIYIFSMRLKFESLLLFLPFLIFNMISLFFSYDVFSSIGYIFYTLYNYIFIYVIFYTWSSNRSVKNVYLIWKKTFLIQGMLLLIEFAIGYIGFEKFMFDINFFRGIPRPSIWFYEPSYLATYLSVFFSISLFLFVSTNKKEYRNDMILSFIFILFVTSTTGYISLLISFLLITFIGSSKSLLSKIKYISLVLSILIILFIIIYFVYPKMINVFLGRIFVDGIMESSGGRIAGWNETFKVFLDNFWFGVGPSAYQAYTNSSSPPTNVTLELLANLGVFGLISFLCFFVGVIAKSYAKIYAFKSEKAKIIKGMIISLIIFGIVLQANQNYLRIYMWMHLGIIAGTSTSLFKEVKSRNENSI